MARQSCCCGTSTQEKAKANETRECCAGQDNHTNQDSCGDHGSCGCGSCGPAPEWMTGTVETPEGPVPRAATKLTFRDVLGSWKCRWSIGRMDYAVEPGLYCVGEPGGDSPVLVTANYKMTFDRLRKELGGIDAWILVLDTSGINVWCASGKGTFGTDELVYRIGAVGLSSIVNHRTVILPQLGAPGIAAHEVAKRSGFHIAWGPVRARDIPEYLSSGMKATREMRTVKFTVWDRLVLTPLELVGSLKYSVIVFGILFILNAIGFGHYGLVDLYAYAGAIFTGCVLTPVLLPWIPGRAFAFKGFLLGLLWAAGVNFINGFPAMPAYGWLKAAAFMLILPSLSAFAAMNFTGSSTYTSLSGVDREMKFALPAMLVSTVVGIILLLVGDCILLFS